MQASLALLFLLAGGCGPPQERSGETDRPSEAPRSTGDAAQRDAGAARETVEHPGLPHGGAPSGGCIDPGRSLARDVEPSSEESARTAHAWRLVATVADRMAPCASPDGRLWFLGADGAIYHGRPESAPGRDGGETDPGHWERIAPPQGPQLEYCAASDDQTVYFTATWSRSGRGTIFQWRKAPEPSGWQELPLPTTGRLHSLTLDPEGTLWTGGQWGDLFRLEAERWVKESVPLPYHIDWIAMHCGGRGWIKAATHDSAAIYQRQDGRWLVAEKSTDAELRYPLWSSPEEIVIQGLESVRRLSARPSAEPARLAELPRYHGGSVLQLDADSGWIVEGNEVYRFGPGSAREHIASLPTHRSGNPIWSDESHLLVLDRTNNLWLLHPAPSPASDRSPRSTVRAYGRYRPIKPDSMIRGINVLAFRGREYLYMVNHEHENRNVAPWKETPSMPETRALGNESIPGSEKWNFAYDMTSVSADLDGDGDEDQILVTHYGGVRVFRNVRDDHFVNWTAESRLPPRGPPRDEFGIGGCLLDADLDGDLDFYLANRLLPDRLHLNNGAAAFRDATEEAGIATECCSSMPVCVDLDGDGDTDVAVATYGRGILLLENRSARGNARFVLHRLAGDGHAYDPRSELQPEYNLSSLAVADVDNDGLPEIFVAAHVGCDRFFRNRGGLRFEEEPAFLPANQPCTGTAGGDFLDFDNDGDLDLALTGEGGSRFYENDQGRLTWSRPLDWDPGVRLPRYFTGSAVLDVDGDGDLEIAHGDDGVQLGSVLYINGTDNDRFVTVRLQGPPANRSAVGAVVRLFRTDEAGRREALVGWRQVPGGSGYGSHSSKWVHFGGTEPGRDYEVEVSLAGAGSPRAWKVRAPYRETISLDAPAPVAALHGLLYRGLRFAGDPWNRAWLGLTAAATILALALLLLLYAGHTKPATGMWPLCACPALSWVLYLGLPLDPGLLPSVLASSTALAVSGTTLALMRSRARERPVPELLTELSFALRTFHHNQTPQRVLNRLQFILRNISEGTAPLGAKRLGLLREDLLSYRETVLPEMETLRRLARSVGIEDPRAARAIDRQRSLVASLLHTSENEKAAQMPAPSAIPELRRAIETAEAWMRALRDETDARLAIDLPEAVARYVASRKAVLGCEVEHVDRTGRAVHVRFLAAELFRVLDVLVENALKAMEGRREPRIAIETARDGDRMAVLSFRDTGPGIPEDARESIFSLGWSRTPGGRGYGLFYARRTVQRFGGQIHAGEAEGGGACFRLVLDAIAPSGARGAA